MALKQKVDNTEIEEELMDKFKNLGFEIVLDEEENDEESEEDK